MARTLYRKFCIKHLKIIFLENRFLACSIPLSPTPNLLTSLLPLLFSKAGLLPLFLQKAGLLLLFLSEAGLLPSFLLEASLLLLFLLEAGLSDDLVVFSIGVRGAAFLIKFSW